MLVDSNVWIDHLHREAEPWIAWLAQHGRLAMHPFVIGELACGTLKNRREVLEYWSDLPELPVAEDAEVLSLIETRQLMGRGLGYIDVHLLASVLLAEEARVWTRDRPLKGICEQLGVAFDEGDAGPHPAGLAG